MRGNIPDFDLLTPVALKDALRLIAEKPGELKPFAGGTDLMVLLEAGSLKHKKYVDIFRLKELRGIEVTPDYVDIGACETFADIQKHPIIQTEFPSLIQAGFETGGLAIQNRGTLGGNIANASPAADSPPALLAYDAQLKVVSAGGERWIPYHKFHQGYKKMDLAPDELIALIRLPRPVPGSVHFYQKAGTRRAQAISKVVFCGLAVLAGKQVKDIRVVIGSVAATTLRCVKTEKILIGAVIDPALMSSAASTLQQEITPLDDIRSTADLRRAVSGNLLTKFLTVLV